jgi:hypothetical protein
MSKLRTRDEIKSMAKDLTKDQLQELFDFWLIEQKKWEELALSPKRHYMDVGTFGDLFHHQVISVDPVNRLAHVKDHSIPKQPVKIVNNIVNEEIFNTKDEAVVYYSKKYPLF